MTDTSKEETRRKPIGAVDFDTFAAMNRTRCEASNGFNHRLDSWSTSDWFTAILGELGEAANVAKKLNRVRDGIRGNKETEELLHTKLRQELGDTFVYLDLLAQALGFTICDAAMEVFDSKSKELGYVDAGRARAGSSPRAEFSEADCRNDHVGLIVTDRQVGEKWDGGYFCRECGRTLFASRPAQEKEPAK